MNVVTLIGNLCTEVELRELGGEEGRELRLAVDRAGRDEGADFVGVATCGTARRGLRRASREGRASRVDGRLRRRSGRSPTASGGARSRSWRTASSSSAGRVPEDVPFEAAVA